MSQILILGLRKVLTRNYKEYIKLFETLQCSQTYFYYVKKEYAYKLLSISAYDRLSKDDRVRYLILASYYCLQKIKEFQSFIMESLSQNYVNTKCDFAKFNLNKNRTEINKCFNKLNSLESDVNPFDVQQLDVQQLDVQQLENKSEYKEIDVQQLDVQQLENKSEYKEIDLFNVKGLANIIDLNNVEELLHLENNHTYTSTLYKYLNSDEIDLLYQKSIYNVLDYDNI